MTGCNTLNLKLPKSQLNKLKLVIKNSTEVTLNFLSNMIGESNNETYFPYKLLLSGTQFSRLCKAFETGSSAHIKISKTRLSKMHSGEFLLSFLEGLTEGLLMTVLKRAKMMVKKVDQFQLKIWQKII